MIKAEKDSNRAWIALHAWREVVFEAHRVIISQLRMKREADRLQMMKQRIRTPWILDQLATLERHAVVTALLAEWYREASRARTLSMSSALMQSSSKQLRTRASIRPERQAAGLSVHAKSTEEQADESSQTEEEVVKNSSNAFSANHYTDESSASGVNEAYASSQSDGSCQTEGKVFKNLFNAFVSSEHSDESSASDDNEAYASSQAEEEAFGGLARTLGAYEQIDATSQTDRGAQLMSEMSDTLSAVEQANASSQTEEEAVRGLAQADASTQAGEENAFGDLAQTLSASAEKGASTIASQAQRQALGCLACAFGANDQADPSSDPAQPKTEGAIGRLGRALSGNEQADALSASGGHIEGGAVNRLAQTFAGKKQANALSASIQPSQPCDVNEQEYFQDRSDFAFVSEALANRIKFRSYTRVPTATDVQHKSNSDVSEEAEKLRKELDARNFEYEELRAMLDGNTEDVYDSVQCLNSQLAEERSLLVQALSQSEAATGANEEAMREVSALEEQVHARNAECNELNAEMAEGTRRSHDQVSVLEEQLHARADESTELKARLVENTYRSHVQISVLEEQLHAKVAECDELNAKTAEDTRRSLDKVKALEEQLLAQNVEYDELNAKMVEDTRLAHDQVSVLEEQLHAKAAECDDLNAKMAEDIRRSHDQVSALEDQLHAKNVEYDELRAKMVEDTRRCHDELRAVEEQLHVKNVEYNELNAKFVEDTRWSHDQVERPFLVAPRLDVREVAAPHCDVLERPRARLGLEGIRLGVADGGRLQGRQEVGAHLHALRWGLLALGQLLLARRLVLEKQSNRAIEFAELAVEKGELAQASASSSATMEDQEVRSQRQRSTSEEEEEDDDDDDDESSPSLIEIAQDLIAVFQERKRSQTF